MGTPIYESRPPKTARAAQYAWDWLQEMRPGDPIKEMWRDHMTYWVWCCEYTSGDLADVDGLSVAKAVNPSAYEHGGIKRTIR